jgi:hypothetical protein
VTLDSPPRPAGATISLYLADGRPGGIRIVEKDNWSGVGVDCSRSDLARASKRDEFGRSGVYLLVGNEGEVGGLPKLYVGEADELRSRMKTHASGKDFWNRAVAFTSKDGSVNKAHAKHLEARLCALAAKAKRCDLDNKVPPGAPKLADSDRDSAERFLAEMLVVLPIVGITAFELPDPATSSESPVLRLERKETSARGQETSQGFRVFEGATARKEPVPSIHPWLAELRADLVQNGALKDNEKGLTLTQDYVFDSPSAAAGVLMGRAANGRTEWRTESGKTLKELQEEALENT